MRKLCPVASILKTYFPLFHILALFVFYGRFKYPIKNFPLTVIGKKQKIGLARAHPDTGA